MPKISDWQPIETVPRDIPVLLTDGRVVVAAVIDSEEFRGIVRVREYGFSGWEWEWEFLWKDLTHWMPLPALPQ